MSPLLSDPINSTFLFRPHTKSPFSEAQRRREDFENRTKRRGNRDPPPFIRHRNRFQHLVDASALTVPHVQFCWDSRNMVASGKSQSWLKTASAALHGLRPSNDCVKPPACAALSCGVLGENKQSVWRGTAWVFAIQLRVFFLTEWTRRPSVSLWNEWTRRPSISLWNDSKLFSLFQCLYKIAFRLTRSENNVEARCVST